MTAPAMPAAAPTCKGCAHFYVTFDATYPYGCRALGFKSRRYPCVEVTEASALPCQARQEKPERAGK